MLREIKRLFKERNALNTEEIANYLKVSEDSLDGMLQILVRKNFIHKVEFDCGTCSSGCKSCPFAKHKDLYEIVH